MSSIQKTNIISVDSDNRKESSNSLVYRLARIDDCHSLSNLINNAYRGELSYQGWTNEDALIPIPRTNPNQLFNMINSNKYIFLLFFSEVDQILTGCINLQHKEESKTAEIGMFVVRPDLQGRGYGKKILSVAENYAINNWNVEYIQLYSIIQRPELIAYYTRRGYIDTGQRLPFPIQLSEFDPSMRDDLEICLMRKSVKKD
ncbi:unnamed protein product [Rotaria sordida]|uniref:N-acetyltransferase domain-containing protein n=1 Tax=Rotaria sordida TaxID=392033 RepID=A0A815BIL6_9BILA|nr:unnamed protein product [Rotaria sordida]CAF1268026.1 unnamed protein product [Rotaria sordida]CAF3802751.1 unnamed protein product [Rotaria sordida]CAF4154261.1 unnamed protein product [Rotaria sordida]